jgi:hypothetical protein
MQSRERKESHFRQALTFDSGVSDNFHTQVSAGAWPTPVRIKAGRGEQWRMTRTWEGVGVIVLPVKVEPGPLQYKAGSMVHIGVGYRSHTAWESASIYINLPRNLPGFDLELIWGLITVNQCRTCPT